MTLFRNEAHRRAGYWLMANHWFMYSAMACVMAHLSRYFDLDLGLNDQNIGLLMALPLGVGVIFQPLWGVLSDRYLGRTNAYRLAQGLTAVLLVFFSLSHQIGGNYLLLAAACAMMIFHSSNAPLSSGLIISFLGIERRHLFGRIRVFGSASFAFTIALLCPLAAAASIYVGVYPRMGIFWLGAAFYLAALCTTFWDVKQFEPHHRPPMKSFLTLIQTPNLLHFYFCLFCLGLGAAGGIQYIGPYIGLRGHSEWFFSSLWAVGVSSEIILTWNLHSIVKRFGLKAIIVFGIASECIRWTGMGMTQNPYLYYLIFTMHGTAVIGNFFAAAMYIDSECDESVRSTAQTLLFFSFVSGQVSGYILSSQIVQFVGAHWSMERVDAIQTSFFAFGAICAFGALWAWLFIKKESKFAVLDAKA
ncbi:MAG: MFS transporter [Candidatus Hinthialibacter antarcticus]|nr:MFS transporter [Candidatus Hinthialibacter antarcticus]